jgi:hypothetical protein
VRNYNKNSVKDLLQVVTALEDFMVVARVDPGVNRFPRPEDCNVFVRLVDDDAVWGVCKNVIKEFRYHQ